jgi:hypothetical protein
MATSNLRHPAGPDLDRFLYSFVGVDRSGSKVTVVSTLARLGLDPWKESSDLAAASEGAGTKRLSKLLSEFRDVPLLMGDHEATARSLISLLPKRAVRDDPSDGTEGSSGTGATLYPSIVAIILIFILFVKLLTPEMASFVN